MKRTGKKKEKNWKEKGKELKRTRKRIGKNKEKN